MHAGGSQPSLWEQFTQQSLPGWKPSLSKRLLGFLYALIGCLFVGLGFFLLRTARGAIEYPKDYTDEKTNDQQVGSFEVQIEKDMEPPIFLYYHIEGFLQNHKRYVSSRDDKQLQAATAEGLESTCAPLDKSADGRPLYPCGLVAGSVFNDTFALTVLEEAGKLRLVKAETSAEAIADSADLQGKFKNLDPEKDENQKKLDMWIIRQFPPVECVQVEFSGEYVPVSVAMESVTGPDGKAKVSIPKCKGYTSGNPTCEFVRKGQQFDCEKDSQYKMQKVKDWGVENGHFISWMRVAGLPTFRKLYAKITEPLKARTTLKVFFQSNFPVKQFAGRKALVLSTATWAGAKGGYLGYGYIAAGGISVLYGLLMGARHLKDGSKQFGTSQETSAILS